jgi:hypothetical protein
MSNGEVNAVWPLDGYKGSSPLEQAAAEVLRDALDLVKFQICGPVDDTVAAEELSPALKALLKALTE